MLVGRLMEIVAFSSSDFFTETLGVVSLTTFVGGRAEYNAENTEEK